MIDKLTQEQEDRLPEFRNKWMNIGLCTDPAERNIAEAGVKKAYEIAELQPPKEIIWCGSPKAMFLEKDKYKNNIGESVLGSVGEFVREFVRESVWGSVRKSVLGSVRKSVRIPMWDSVSNSVWESMQHAVGESLGGSIYRQVGESIYRQYDTYWLALYDYINQVLGLTKETTKLEGLWAIAKSAGWCLPYEGVCFISERHNICELKEGQVHKDGGPAIAYPDGWKIWALNGVLVPQEIAETPWDKLDSRMILTETNMEVRREIVRKIGIEKICSDLRAKCIDKQDGYELLNLDLEDNNYRPYLKMLNPSIGTYHIEGVSPDCDTVESALKFRNNTIIKPEILT